MTDSPFDRVRHRIDEPVPPSESFARSLLERLQEELAGEVVDIRDELHRRRPPGLSAEELEREAGEQLPLREAMSVIDPGVAAPATGATLGPFGDEVPNDEVPNEPGGQRTDVDPTN